MVYTRRPTTWGSLVLSGFQSTSSMKYAGKAHALRGEILLKAGQSVEARRELD